MRAGWSKSIEGWDTFVAVDLLVVVRYQLDSGPVVEASPGVDFKLEVVNVRGGFKLRGQNHLRDIAWFKFELELDSFLFAEFHILSFLPILVDQFGDLLSGLDSPEKIVNFLNAVMVAEPDDYNGDSLDDFLDSLFIKSILFCAAYPGRSWSDPTPPACGEA